MITIVRDKLTWIKSTILKDFKSTTDLYGITVTPDINPNRQEQVYYINGSEFAFFGLDYAQKLHGRSQDWFWINEVMEVSKSEFDQLEMRTNVGGIIDYNPSDDSHWVFDLERRGDVAVIKSTMLDNPFLPKTITDKIRSYEPTPENIARGTADLYMWEVYGLGNKARLRGVVFENWDVVNEIPEGARHIGYGLDFGYTNDPTALVEGYIFNNELYLNELIYETGLVNQDISDRMKSLGISRDDEIFADSSEPKSIEEIYRSGFNIHPVKKGQDSISFGIGVLKSYKVHLTKKSVNMDRERRKYKWAEDKAGNPTNKPVDAFNHAIDAGRYLAMEKLAKDDELTSDDIFFG